MPSVVAIAGGSGGLGRTLVEVLRADSRYEPVILARNANAELEKELGVRVLTTGYSNTDSLVELFENNNVWAVLSVMNTIDKTPEANLIEAADRSSTTKRFIPNIWSAFTYGQEHIQTFPYAGVKFAAIEALNKTGLEWTQIYTGFFLDYIIVNHPTHMRPIAKIVDVENNVAGLPGTGSNPIHFTYSYDVAKYTAALLAMDTWEKNYYIAGDIQTWSSVVEVVERAKGVKFDVVYDSRECLEKGEIKEIPGQRSAGDALGGEKNREMLRRMAVNFRLWQIQGLASKREGVCLGEVVREIEPLTLEKAWKGYI